MWTVSYMGFMNARRAIVGAPRYFATRPIPMSPDDLVHHSCINFRRHR
jgi:hypothetical protein